MNRYYDLFFQRRKFRQFGIVQIYRKIDEYLLDDIDVDPREKRGKIQNGVILTFENMGKEKNPYILRLKLVRSLPMRN